VTVCVIDASIALTWCFEDEASPETDAIFDLVRDQGALVPAHWCVEVGNVLRQAELRGRIAPEDVTARLALMASLRILTDTETSDRAWRETMSLARSERLTVYDAAYLELALRRGLPLATLDRDLIAAAARLGAAVLPA